MEKIPATATQTISLFPKNTFLENLAIDETGMIYVTSLEEGAIYRLHPAQGAEEKELAARIDGKPVGILHLENTGFLVNAWDANGVPTLYLLAGDTIKPLHQPAGAQFLNGMTALDPPSVLICDSYKGCLWRYDLETNTSSIWLQHPLLEKADPATPMPAANGIKRSGEAVYVSNTDKQLLIRIPLIAGQAGEPAVFLDKINLDDFAFDEEGNIYAATHIHNSVVKITPQKTVTTIAGEAQGLTGSTAVAFGRTPQDRHSIYVTTNGGMSLPSVGGIQNARVVKINVRIPTPCEWAGGVPAFEKLTDIFYTKVLQDPILEPIFRHMPPQHAKHVAHFLAEVLKGPRLYSEEYGQDALKHMVGKHLGKHLSEAQRKRWVQLLMDSADEIGIPADPEFRSTFTAHIEWGSRIAVINSQTNENPVTGEDHIPQWGWGEVKGPFEVVGSLFREKPDDRK